jgi:hypothetical protein
MFNAAALVGLYLISTAALIFGNANGPNLEPPWTWVYVIWAAVFSPALAATIFAAVMTVPDTRRLRVLSAIALLVILAAMQACLLVDASLGWAMFAAIVVSIAIVAAFRWFADGGRQGLKRARTMR